MEKTPYYYHSCQHPETLSMDSLTCDKLYLAFNESDWTSPWLNDIRNYRVTLKPGVNLAKVYSSVYLEYFIQDPDFLTDYFTDGYDGLEFRCRAKEDPDFNEGGVYSDYVWLEPRPGDDENGGDDGDQIVLLNARNAVGDVIFNRGSKFDLVKDRYYDVTLPRSELEEINHISVPDIYDTFNLKRLMRQFGPRFHHWDSCLYKVTPSTVTLRFMYDINKQKGFDLNENIGNK